MQKRQLIQSSVAAIRDSGSKDRASSVEADDEPGSKFDLPEQIGVDGDRASDIGTAGERMAAVDKELATVGLQPSSSGPGDVLVTYYSISRTDVDVKAKPDEKGLRPEHTVGSLVVALLDPASRKPAVQLRIDKPIERADIEGSINTLVPELFTKYPGKDAKKP